VAATTHIVSTYPGVESDGASTAERRVNK